jgi:hypothetical protein
VRSASKNFRRKSADVTTTASFISPTRRRVSRRILDLFLAWHRQSYPGYVGPCRYARATTPFRAEDVLTHIANCARPLTEDLVVWLEDLSERYPYEWAEVAQVRRKGGQSLNPAPIPGVEVVLKLGLGWSLWVKVQRIAWGWLARRQLRHLRLRQWQVQRRLHDVVGSATQDLWF